MVKTLSDLYLEARRAFMVMEEPQGAGLLARNLLAHVTGMTQEQVIADRDKYVGDNVCNAMSAAVERIKQGEPLAYILGEWEFYGLTLQVNHDVLIPRDDSCAVTSLAIEHALFLNSAPRILDLCTGSGCIGLAVASRVKDAKVTLADLSKDALNVARKNVSAQRMGGRVTCVQADAMEKASSFLGKFDMIISNPPYITDLEMTELPVSVKNYEPAMALRGGSDGLDFYRSITQNYQSALKPGGFLAFEFGMGQGDDVCRILRENHYNVLERKDDFNGRERAVIAQFEGKDN